VAAVGLALDHAGAFQLLQHAVQRRLGQAGFFHQRRQGEEVVLARDHFQQREQAQRGRVAVDGDGLGQSFAGGGGIHGRILYRFVFRYNLSRFFLTAETASPYSNRPRHTRRGAEPRPHNLKTTPRGAP
jgi:hypothetical protein